VLADVLQTARAYRGEIFEPVAPIASFGDLPEAAGLAAGTEYGLSLSIITKDVMAGLELAEQIPAGMVSENPRPRLRLAPHATSFHGSQCFKIIVVPVGLHL
jgi:acyl-CoA reductase-like NAD-dependent aldehyde dehydrogenase